MEVPEQMIREDAYELAVVKLCFTPPAYVLTGWALKGLSRLGDRVAATYIMSTPEEMLFDERSCRAFARAAKHAFDYPESIACRNDLTPCMTIFLLERMLTKELNEETRRAVGDTLVALKNLR